MINVLGLINFGLLLIFGILLSISFAGVEITRKNYRIVVILILLLLVAQVVCWLMFNFQTTRKLYPFIVHIPLALFIIFYYKRKWTVTLISVTCAYLCCQIPQWFAYVAQYLSHSNIPYLITDSIAILPVFYLLKRYVASSVNRLMLISRKSLLLFGIIPFSYYLFDYATTVYTNLLFRGSKVAVLFMPSVVSMFYFVFIIFYYDEIQRRSKAENERLLLSVQIKQAQSELSAFRESQEKTAVYRHDMRHHLNLIAGFLTEGSPQKAKEYIFQVQSDIEEITPIRYCENNTIDLILSYYTAKAKESNISFTVDVQIPEDISIAETELCALLSNGLENAMNACAKVPDSKIRTVHINCKVHKDNLLIFIENSYAGDLVTENGLPASTQEGHGFGMRSIRMITEKYNGYCSFSAKDGIFTIRIVLPIIE